MEIEEIEEQISQMDEQNSKKFDKAEEFFIQKCCDPLFLKDALAQIEDMSLEVLEYAKIRLEFFMKSYGKRGDEANFEKLAEVLEALSCAVSMRSVRRAINNIISSAKTKEERDKLEEINEDFFNAVYLDSIDFAELGDEFITKIENLLYAKAILCNDENLKLVQKQFHRNVKHFRTEKSLLMCMAKQTKTL